MYAIPAPSGPVYTHVTFEETKLVVCLLNLPIREHTCIVDYLEMENGVVVLSRLDVFARCRLFFSSFFALTPLSLSVADQEKNDCSESCIRGLTRFSKRFHKAMQLKTAIKILSNASVVRERTATTKPFQPRPLAIFRFLK